MHNGVGCFSGVVNASSFNPCLELDDQVNTILMSRKTLLATEGQEFYFTGQDGHKVLLSKEWTPSAMDGVGHVFVKGQYLGEFTVSQEKVLN